MDKEDILEILLMSIDSKYKVSWCCRFLTNVDDGNIMMLWTNSNSVNDVLELIYMNDVLFYFLPNGDME
jgi:hypothetical protein